MILSKIKLMFEYFSPSKNFDLIDGSSEIKHEWENMNSVKKSFELHGHRGARGLAPENTLPSFEQAIEIGVDAIELDVVITKDEKVLVSHEAWMNPEICLDKNKREIQLSDLDKYRIFQMNFEETQDFDCGLKSNERFPEQFNEECTKPLLSSVLQMSRALSKNHGKKLKYSIEIKSFPEGDEIFHPKPSRFSRLVVEVIRKYVNEDSVYIQSFDKRILQHFKSYYPAYKLGYLIEHNNLDQALDELGFQPHFYGIKHSFIDAKTIKQAHKNDCKVFAWTVNEENDLERLVNLNIDTIVTDYPNKALRYK